MDQDHMYRNIGSRWICVPYIDVEQLKGASPSAWLWCSLELGSSFCFILVTWIWRTISRPSAFGIWVANHIQYWSKGNGDCSRHDLQLKLSYLLHIDTVWTGWDDHSLDTAFGHHQSFPLMVIYSSMVVDCALEGVELRPQVKSKDNAHSLTAFPCQKIQKKPTILLLYQFALTWNRIENTIVYIYLICYHSLFFQLSLLSSLLCRSLSRSFYFWLSLSTRYLNTHMNSYKSGYCFDK